MSIYRIGQIDVRRVAEDRLELKINNEKATVFTEDLAALVASELPEDRARELLEGCESEIIRKGKAMVIVRAQKDIKKGEAVKFQIDVTKYQNREGIRVTKNGLIY